MQVRQTVVGVFAALAFGDHLLAHRPDSAVLAGALVTLFVIMAAADVYRQDELTAVKAELAIALKHLRDETAEGQKAQDVEIRDLKARISGYALAKLQGG